MENQKVYLCEDTIEGIFTAIYDAWADRQAEAQLSMQCRESYVPRLFTDVIEVETDAGKAVKVMRSVKAKLGWKAYDMMYHAALSCEEDKIDAIYRFLKKGFKVGAGVADMHGEAVVCRMFDLQRGVKNEAHFFREFLRFHETKQGVLIARIKPKNQVLSFVTEHFSDRFPDERFVILDEVHFVASFHTGGKEWFLRKLSVEELEHIWALRGKADYEDLWRTFFHTIAIEERKNPKCQRNMCAYRYRDYMVEFH